MKNAPAFTQGHSGNGQGSEGSHFTSDAPVLRYLTRKEQHAVILRSLGVLPKTSDDLRGLGCYMPNSRIHELRALGYSITTALVWVVGVDGRRRKMAKYSLSEPADNWKPAKKIGGE